MPNIKENIINLINKYTLEVFNENDDDLIYFTKISKNLVTEFKSNCDQLEIDYKIIINEMDRHILKKENTSTEINDVLDTILPEQIKIELELKKQNLYCNEFSKNFKVIIFSNTSIFVKQILNKSLSDLSSYLFEDTKPTIVGFINDDINIKNNHIILTRIDELLDYNDAWKKTLIEYNDSLNNKNDILKKFNENIHWNDKNTNVIPEQYHITSRDSSEIKNIFNKHFVSLSTCYLAQYNSFNQESMNYQSIFNGLKNIQVNHNIDETSMSETKLSTLKSFVDWAYDGKKNITDKITLIQTICSIQLEEECDLNQLLSKISEIHDSSIENYKAYLENNLEKFFSQRQEFENLIQYISDKISEQISNITSLVIKNFYGVIAASITSIITLSKNMNVEILPYILYVYSLFIFLLTIYFTVFSHMKINSIVNLYNTRKEEFRKYFLPNKLKRLEANAVEKQKNIYKTFLILTWIINILFIAIAIGAAVSVQIEQNIFVDAYNYVNNHFKLLFDFK